jgi:TonB family protein
MRIFLLLAVATAFPASPAPAVAETPKEPARARANLASYLTAADYPPAAIRAGEQGTVHFRLDVGTDGRVTGCTITESSGSSILDSTTCRILYARARFIPATDAAGKPVPDRVASTIRWVIPEDGRADSPEMTAAMKLWAQCLEPFILEQLAAGSSSPQEMADKAFPGCVAEEQKVAAVLAADAAKAPAGAPGETTDDLRKSFVRFLEDLKAGAKD